MCIILMDLLIFSEFINYLSQHFPGFSAAAHLRSPPQLYVVDFDFSIAIEFSNTLRESQRKASNKSAICGKIHLFQRENALFRLMTPKLW